MYLEYGSANAVVKMNEEIKMGFRIRKKETNQDMENFFVNEFKLVKEHGFIQPVMSEEEAFEKHVEELLDFINSKGKAAIFIAENDKGEFAGSIWVSFEEKREIWFFNHLAWIYGVRVDPRFRGQGLGRKLVLQAEHWAKNEGFTEIGLRVFGFNAIAIIMYGSLSYTIKSYRFHKQITPENIVIPARTNFRIRKVDTEQDRENIIALGYGNFKKLIFIEKKIREEKIREKYINYINSFDSDGSKVRIFAIEDKKGVFAGFVRCYISQDDLSGKKYVWLQDLEVVPAFRKQGLEKQLLGHTERWTKENGLDIIRASVHALNDIGINLFQSTGYKKFIIFMEKRLGKIWNK